MKIAALTGLGLVGQLGATDFRSPISTQLGPLHYTFDKLHKKKSNFNIFSTAHFRETDDAFISHGTSTHPLSQLIFGKSEFTVGESFQGGKASTHGYTENYTPYLDLTKLAPRVSYTEMGVFIGAYWDYPIWRNRGRVGIRGSLPIRWVRMERDNEAEHNLLGLQQDVLKGDMRRVNPFDASTNQASVIGGITSYRLKLLKNLMYINNTGHVVTYYRTNPVTGQVTLGNPYDRNPAEYGTTDSRIPFVVIQAATSGQPPIHQGGALLVGNGTGGTTNGQPYDGEQGTVAGGGTWVLYPVAETNPANNNIVQGLPLTGNVTTPPNPATASLGRADVFVDNTDYRNLDVDSATDLWVTTINGQNTSPIQTSENHVDFIDGLLLYYSKDIELWLKDRGFMLATDEQTGLGDIPVEVFYEHSFNDKWRGELCLGVKFPTGNGGDDYAGNPYRVQMGNGSHWEIKIGGLLAWQAFRWMNVKLDLSYNFALEQTEDRCAVYKGSTIKNFGPKAPAEVDWGYFLGNLDLNFTHPKTKKIMGTIGYQLYYKTEDHIDFKDKKQTTWLGKVWADPDGNPATATTAGTQWVDLQMDLDGGLARKNTEQWGHRIRLEGTYKLSKYMCASVGALYTFAGQNIPVEADMHCACRVNF